MTIFNFQADGIEFALCPEFARMRTNRDSEDIAEWYQIFEQEDTGDWQMYRAYEAVYELRFRQVQDYIKDVGDDPDPGGVRAHVLKGMVEDMLDARLKMSLYRLAYEALKEEEREVLINE